jgi:hypothetical protein
LLLLSKVKIENKVKMAPGFRRDDVDRNPR